MTPVSNTFQNYDARAMIGALLNDHESVIHRLCKDLEMCANEHGDEGTKNFLTGLMRRHEKTACMLRACLR